MPKPARPRPARSAKKSAAPRAAARPVRAWHKAAWLIGYLAWAALCALGGYQIVGHRAGTGTDAVTLFFGFVFALAAPLAVVSDACAHAQGAIARGSLLRNFRGWPHTDPLQWTAVAILTVIALACGNFAALARPESTEQGLIFFWLETVIAIGLISGQRWAMSRYDGSIASRR